MPAGDFQAQHRRLLRERCERLCRLVELNAPQAVLDFTASLTLRGIVYAVGPSVLANLGKHLIGSAKVSAGLCSFCPEERPLDPEKEVDVPSLLGFGGDGCGRDAARGGSLVTWDDRYDEPVDHSPCAACHGAGFTTRAEHDPACTGDERSCSRLCPVEVQEPCEECGPTFEQYLSQFSYATPETSEEVSF